MEKVFDELSTMAAEEDAAWKSGQVSGTYYHAGDEHRAFLNRVFALYSHVNVLQVDLCPSLSKMEGEIVSMSAHLMNGGAVKVQNPEHEVSGTVTSGGTESILMAMKTYRDQARAERGITQPEVVVPKTAHPAFQKAGDYFGIQLIWAPVSGPNYLVNASDAECLISDNTVAIVGSAGNYPYGLVDPMEDLSELALKHGVGLHVDGCLGGFILPWVEKLGYDVPIFDFRLPGVTSISADTHKFGFGLKGTSVILYRSKHLRHYQFFHVPDWPGGIYASPAMTGSRSGGLIASTWAAMVYLGQEGYLQSVEAIMKVADDMKNGVKENPELQLIGDPTFVISFGSEVVDVFHVNDYMIAQGWRFNSLQHPPALHFCVTMPQTKVVGLAERFSKDLRAGVEYAKSVQGTSAKSGAMYALSGSPEGHAALGEMVFGMMDYLYHVENTQPGTNWDNRDSLL